MKVVSEKSEEEIALERAERKVVTSLRVLAANILRCAAGNGRDYELVEQCVNFVLAVRERDAIMPGPIDAPYHLAASTALKDHRDWVEDSFHADSSLRDAAMQIQAAYLLDQMTQVTTGENKLHSAIHAQGYKRSPRDADR